MIGYPSLRDIEVRWRTSGSGVCVIVEGETELDDAWYYHQWFGDRAREITFFAQDGWEAVVDAVATLRATLGSRRVYGIVDRDFADQVTYDPFPPDGVLCTVKYTLENHLLDPEVWFRYIHPHKRRASTPGWNTLEETQVTIEHFYRQCAPLSAYNWTLRRARQASYEAFQALPATYRRYVEHPLALANLGDIITHLRQVQTQMQVALDLVVTYHERLAYLQTCPLAELEQTVSGKYVLTVLFESFPIKLGGKRARDDVLSYYLFLSPTPPADLTAIMDAILRDAHVYRLED